MGQKGKLGLLLIVEVGCGHQVRLRMKEAEDSGKVIAWAQLKIITKIFPEASQGACDTDGGSHLSWLKISLGRSTVGQSVCLFL